MRRQIGCGGVELVRKIGQTAQQGGFVSAGQRRKIGIAQCLGCRLER